MTYTVLVYEMVDGSVELVLRDTATGNTDRAARAAAEALANSYRLDGYRVEVRRA